MSWTEEILRLGNLELKLVPGIGGRLMDVVYQGSSLLFQNPDLVGLHPDLATLDQLPSRASHLPFPLWGGEKTWIAPESDWPNGAPYEALDSGCYSFRCDDLRSATMISAICPQSGLQIKRVITLTGSDSWTVDHHVTNMGAAPRSVGLWSVMMTQKPASYFFPAKPEHQPGTVFGNPDGVASLVDGTARIDCQGMQEFKLGAHPRTGLAAARIAATGGAVWLVTQTNTLGAATDYAHGHALEAYNSGHYDYGELEWHSPMAQMLPGQSHSFDQHYRVFRETPDQTALEVFEMIQNEDEVGQ